MVEEFLTIGCRVGRRTAGGGGTGAGWWGDGSEKGRRRSEKSRMEATTVTQRPLREEEDP
jgi:hypothetical protein